VLQHSPLPNVPLVAKKGPKAQDIQKEKLQTITNSGKTLSILLKLAPLA
jgi:hypothetical protein